MAYRWVSLQPVIRLRVHTSNTAAAAITVPSSDISRVQIPVLTFETYLSGVEDLQW